MVSLRGHEQNTIKSTNKLVLRAFAQWSKQMKIKELTLRTQKSFCCKRKGCKFYLGFPSWIWFSKHPFLKAQGRLHFARACPTLLSAALQSLKTFRLMNSKHFSNLTCEVSLRQQFENSRVPLKSFDLAILVSSTNIFIILFVCKN